MGRALLNLFEFYKQYKILRCSKAGDLKTGDIVVCFTNTSISCLGKVVHSGHTDLIHNHEDGPYGEVFVLPYFKARVKAGHPYNTQSGWWMFNEVSLLPRKNEHFSQGKIAKSVMYTGHKPTTRREQIQENWTIEIADKDDDADDADVIVQGSPRRRSPRKSGKSGRKAGRRRIVFSGGGGGRRPVGTMAKAKAKAKNSKAAKAQEAEANSNAKAKEAETNSNSTTKDAKAKEAEATSSNSTKDAKANEATSETPAKATKKKLNLQTHNNEFDTPDLAPKKKLRKNRFSRDIVYLALAGDTDPLKEYIEDFDFEARVPETRLTQSEWDSILPGWTSKEKSRGLKQWRSKTARGQWQISGVCAKVINQAVSIYMEIFGYPPVFEGVRSKTSFSLKAGGLDFYTPFILTVHRAYCQKLNPQVEVGTVAYDKVLQYMNTRPVRLKLLRAVRDT